MNELEGEWRSISLKFQSKCFECQKELQVGHVVLWNPGKHQIKCLEHLEQAETNRNLEFSKENNPELIEERESKSLGVPGGSAKAMAERLSKKREERIQKRFPRLGNFMLAVTDEPQSTRAWESGAQGEIGIGKELEKLAAKYGFKVIHDRLIPNSRANIDHIAVTRSGVFVIDAKNYVGTIRVVDNSGIFSDPDPKLYVGRRNCTNLVVGMHRQTDVVKKVLASESIEMQVTGVIDFYRGEWESFSSFFPQEQIQGVLINNKTLLEIVMSKGTHSPKEIERVTQILATKLLSAT